jgi:hypothetical protein
MLDPQSGFAAGIQSGPDHRLANVCMTCDENKPSRAAFSASLKAASLSTTGQ